MSLDTPSMPPQDSLIVLMLAVFASDEQIPKELEQVKEEQDVHIMKEKKSWRSNSSAIYSVFCAMNVHDALERLSPGI